MPKEKLPPLALEMDLPSDASVMDATVDAPGVMVSTNTWAINLSTVTEAFDPSKYSDAYREAVLELIERKADGSETSVSAPTDDGEDQVIDLMAALEASVAAAKEARKAPKDEVDEPAAESA